MQGLRQVQRAGRFQPEGPQRSQRRASKCEAVWPCRYWRVMVRLWTYAPRLVSLARLRLNPSSSGYRIDDDQAQEMHEVLSNVGLTTQVCDTDADTIAVGL